MNVLNGSKNVLIHTFLYKKIKWTIGPIQIPYVILNFGFILPMLLNTFLMCNRIRVELRNSGGFKEISGSFYISIGTLSAVCIYVSLSTNHKLVLDLVEIIETVVKKRSEQSTNSRMFFSEIFTKNEIFVRKIKIFATYMIISTLVVPVLCPVGYAIFGFPKPHLWFFPFQIAVWWDTTHAFGYYIALLPQIGGTLTYMTSIKIMITFFASICTYIEAWVDDLSTIIRQMNEIATEYTAKDRNNEKIGLQLRCRIVDMIELHIDILRIMDTFRLIMSGPLFYQLFVYVVFLALNLLQFDNNFYNITLAMALNINALVNQILFNYVTCNYSTNVMSKVNMVDDLVFNAHWYEYPVADQKLLPFVIQRTRKPIWLAGFGVIICSMETFLTLLKSAISYFIMFRQFS